MSDYLRDRTYSGQRGVAPALAKMPVRPARFGQATGGGMASRNRAATGSGQHERMSAVDTAWLRMDGPANTMMIVSVMTTATPVPAADLRRVLETRLLCFPRFPQARRDRSPRRLVGRRHEFRPGRAFHRDRTAGQGRTPRAAGAGSKAGRPAVRPGTAAVATALRRALRDGQRVGAPVAPLLRGRHRDDPGAAVADRTGCGPRARRSPRSAISRRVARTTQRRRGPAASARLDQPADPTRGRHRRKRPGRGRATARDGRAQAVSSGDRRGDRSPGEGHGRRICAGPRAARRPCVTAACDLERREASGLVGAARPAGSQDREPGARLHRQRRADVHRGRRVWRIPARRRVRQPGTSSCARRCR